MSTLEGFTLVYWVLMIPAVIWANRRGAKLWMLLTIAVVMWLFWGVVLGVMA